MAQSPPVNVLPAINRSPSIFFRALGGKMIELLTLATLGPVVSSMADLVGAVFGPSTKARGVLIELDAQNRFEQANANRRHQELMLLDRLADKEAQRRQMLLSAQAALIRDRNAAADCPTGRPGRIRESLPHGLAPCVIVSPNSRIDRDDPFSIASDISDIIRQIDTSGQMVHVVSGGFVRDRNGVREIDGEVGAAEIARNEFRPRPSIIIRFERSSAGTTAHALISDMVRTTDNQTSFETPVARLTGDDLEFAALPGSDSDSGFDLEWVRRPAAVPGATPQTAFATAIAIFALTISSVYWRLQGVRWKFERTQAHPINRMRGAANEIVGAGGVPVRDERLLHELTELRAVFGDVELVELASAGTVAVYVALAGRAVTFVIEDDYPNMPPGILLRQDDGRSEQIRLDSSQWSPSRSLLDLAEAFA